MNLVITFQTEEDKKLFRAVQEKLVANGCLWASGDTHLNVEPFLMSKCQLFQVVNSIISWGLGVTEERFNGEEYTTLTAREYLVDEPEACGCAKAESAPVKRADTSNLVITFLTEEDRALADKVQEKLVANGCLWRSGMEHRDFDRLANLYGATLLQIDGHAITHGYMVVPATDGVKYKTLTAREYLGVKEESAEKPSILQTAETILNGDRQADYSDPVKNFENIAKLASIITGKELTPEECCVVLMCVKLIREGFKHKEDNLVDLAAYAEILNRIKSK